MINFTYKKNANYNFSDIPLKEISQIGKDPKIIQTWGKQVLLNITNGTAN